jgi:hypothetical protein
MPEQHTILGGKVYIYKRPNSSLWQCYFAGKNRRTSTNAHVEDTAGCDMGAFERQSD